MKIKKLKNKKERYVTIIFYKDKNIVKKALKEVKELEEGWITSIVEVNNEIFAFEFTYHNKIYRKIYLSEDVGFNYRYDYNKNRKITVICYEDGVDKKMLQRWSKDQPYLVKMIKEKEND